MCCYKKSKYIVANVLIWFPDEISVRRSGNSENTPAFTVAIWFETKAKVSNYLLLATISDNFVCQLVMRLFIEE